MKSIGRQLMLGVAIAGAIGTGVLAVLVVQHYGLLSSSPPPPGQAVAEITEHVVIPVGLFLVLFAVGVFLVVRNLKRQLNRLSGDILAAVEKRASYETPVQDLPSELKPFGEAVNRLTCQLEQHAKRQEAFAADAAHELKTPLAMLALQLDSLEAADAEKFGVQIRALSEMIDQLLLLARSNSPDLASIQRMVDPAELGRRIVAELAPRAIAEGKTMVLDINHPVAFCGLEDAVAAALRTLASNALRAVSAGGEVRIGAGPGPVLAVLDSGQGLTPQTLEHLKARGVRADQAPGGSAGLGLAIADRIVEAHGGDLLTCRPEQSGLRMEFPAQKA